jgi:hypothetical protein
MVCALISLLLCTPCLFSRLPSSCSLLLRFLVLHVIQSEAAEAKEEAQRQKDIRLLGDKYAAELQAWETEHGDVQIPLSVKKYFARVCSGIPAQSSRAEFNSALVDASTDVLSEYGMGERDLTVRACARCLLCRSATRIVRQKDWLHHHRRLRSTLPSSCHHCMHWCVAVHHLHWQGDCVCVCDDVSSSSVSSTLLPHTGTMVH